MNKVLEIKNLKKRFGKFYAVNDISFDIKKGEVFGFLGPNGAGKSTTIRCIMDFIRPTEGEINVFGLDSYSDSVVIKNKVGYLPGNVRLYEKWTGWEHIRFVESIHGRSKIVDELIEKLDFDPKKKFKNLSSGNKQKLGLILAVMNEPDLLIMDEPTVGLDPLLQNKIYEILGDLKKNGTTVLISSHNLPEVEKICDRVGIIKNGKMVAVEAVKELGQMKLNKIEVRFKGKFKKSEFEGDGVDSIDEIEGGLLLSVSGDINPVLKKIASHEVLDLEIGHADLEDVFLKFYEPRT